MIKLLIVDDEQIEREGLLAILGKGFPDIALEQAKNGKIAVQMARDIQPDLILMDIKMPGMNGLEAVEQIGRDAPDIKFVMVTAHDTFEYARSAIRLGVNDYLLKPSKAGDIVETVGRVIKQIEEERMLLAVSRRQQTALKKTLPLVETDVVTQLLFDHVHEVHLDVLVELLDNQAIKESFVMLVLLPSGSENLYTAIKEKVRQAGNGWVGALYGRQLPIIVFRDAHVSFRSQAVILARGILSVATADSRNNWFVGIGNTCDSLEQIRQSYQESLIATMDTTLPVRYRFYSDGPVSYAAGDGQLIKLGEKQFFEQIRLGQWEKVRSNIMDFIQHYENQGANLLQTQQRVLELFWIASRVLSEMGIETDTPFYSYQAQDFRQLYSETGQLLERMRQSYIEHHGKLKPDTVQQIKLYIVEHSHEHISLDAIARNVGLSPIYISKLFKEQVGMNYIDFLTECRIEQAKKLMADPDKRLKEIAFDIGYHDPNYFSKVFKKMCNVSPTEYRKMLFGTKG